MRKFLGVAVLCLSSSVFAADKSQSRPAAPAPKGFLESHNLTIGVDTEAALPVGNYADINGIGMGLYANAELALYDTISGTMRIGFQGHLDKTNPLGFDSHVNALPILVGAKAWLGEQRQGLFGTFEMGLFDLMSSVTQNGVSGSSSELKFGMGLGAGYQQGHWNARLALYTHDVGNFGDAMMLTGGVGYSFSGL